jgi:F0F1-type ATP synthase alpha subunit
LGGAVQKDNIKKIGAVVRRELLSYLETADVYQLVKIDSMSADLQEKIYRGKKMLDLLKQPKFSPRSEAKMIETFGFVMSGSMTMLQDEEKKNESNKKDTKPPKSEPKKPDKPVKKETPKVIQPQEETKTIQPMMNISALEENQQKISNATPIEITNTPTEIKPTPQKVTEEEFLIGNSNPVEGKNNSGVM